MTWAHLLIVLCLSVLVTGCELAVDILELGAWMGAIAVILVVALIVFIASKIRG